MRHRQPSSPADRTESNRIVTNDSGVAIPFSFKNQMAGDGSTNNGDKSNNNGQSAYVLNDTQQTGNFARQRSSPGQSPTNSNSIKNIPSSGNEKSTSAANLNKVTKQGEPIDIVSPAGRSPLFSAPKNAYVQEHANDESNEG